MMIVRVVCTRRQFLPAANRRARTRSLPTMPAGGGSTGGRGPRGCPAPRILLLLIVPGSFLRRHAGSMRFISVATVEQRTDWPVPAPLLLRPAAPAAPRKKWARGGS